SGFVSPDTLEIYGDITKYIIPKYEFGYELYNLEDDPEEKINLLKEKGFEIPQLKKKLEFFRKKVAVLGKEKNKDKAKKLEDLKSLGYIR
ncbi:MAG: hypothetical protein ACP5J6_11260, partial [Candidatus Saccharicenans sp.]